MIKYFKGSPNISENFGPGSKYYGGPNIPLQNGNDEEAASSGSDTDAGEDQPDALE